MSELHPVPLSIEGAAVLHQMFRFDWPIWNDLTEAERESALSEARILFEQMETAEDGQSAFFTVYGHKGDLLFVHFRRDFEQLSQAQRSIDRLRLREFLEPSTSYVSIVELGLYESTVKLYRSLKEQGIAPHSEQWMAAVEETLQRQREAMGSRLYPEIPPTKYVCFYPMDRRRGEQNNWYTLSIEERQRQMQEHGGNGRRYAGAVKQIISSSIGFDDWEWGVDLFADEPVVFKRLVYELRFDEASAKYSEFGPFYIGKRFRATELEQALNVG